MQNTLDLAKEYITSAIRKTQGQPQALPNIGLEDTINKVQNNQDIPRHIDSPENYLEPQTQAQGASQTLSRNNQESTNSQFCTMKLKIILIVIGSLLGLTGVSLAIYFGINHFTPTAVETSQVKLSYANDSSQVIILGVNLKENNLFDENIDVDLQVLVSLQNITDNKTGQGRFLQNVNSQYQVFLTNQSLGMTARVGSSGSSVFYIDVDNFFALVTQQAAKDPQGRRLLQESSNNPPITQQQKAQVMSQLNEEFTQAFKNETKQQDITVLFNQVEMVKLKLNPFFGRMQFDTSPRINPRLLAQVVRNLFLKKIFKKVTKIFTKVAVKAVNLVRKHGPLIGKVVGGVIGGVAGFFVGGPMGAFQGAKAGIEIGGMIGTAAQTFVNACIPQGSLKIRCTKSSLKSAMTQFSATFSGSIGGLGGLSGSSGSSGGDLTSGFKSMMGKIPLDAISNYGIGLF